MLLELLKAGTWMVFLLCLFWYLMTPERTKRQVQEITFDCTRVQFQKDIPMHVRDACKNRLVYEQDAAAMSEQIRLNKRNDSIKH